MMRHVSTSLKVTVPLILLAFAAILSTVNLLYHVPRAERAAEEDARKRLAQEVSRLQSTLEYLLLKGDESVAQREISVLAHNHDVVLAAMTDDQQNVIAATRRAWLGSKLADVLPQFDLDQATEAIRQRRAGLTVSDQGNELLGYAGILMGGGSDELRSSRTGSLLLAYDLERYKAEARRQVVQQSIYWAGWVIALALFMWLVFHFVITRRTARLVEAAEQIAAGNLAARSGLKGMDELARLSRSFDAMALEVAETQMRLRQDIEERARVQRKLEESETRLQQILNNATAVVCVKDTAGRFLFVNRQWEHLYHFQRGDVIGRTELECLPEDIARTFRANDLLVLGRDAPMEFEETARLADGVHTYISNKFPLHDASGVAYGVCTVSTDITERKRANEALRASEASYRAIFDAAEDAIFVHDIETGAIVDANPRACLLFGYTLGELRDIDIGLLGSGVPPYAHDDAMAIFSRAVAGEDVRIEWHGRRNDGALRWLEVFAKRVIIGGQDRILSLARDITENKRAAAELVHQRESSYQREKLAALGSLLAGVSHELNNPLSVVVARAVLLEERGDGATQVAAMKIRTAAERCARIVRTFLAMARQQPPERGPVAINEIVTAALDIAAYGLRSGGVDVSLDLADDLPRVLADADQLHQVLLNLVINAQHSLQDEPGPRRLRVTSRFDAGAGRVRIVVADNGPGIPSHLRARVFEPYFTTKPVGVGTGVGLAVSLGIVEAHGGTLTVHCPPEGGAEFTISLPVEHAEAVPVEPGAAIRANARQRTILVVDDEAEIRDALAEILTTAGHRVRTAGSGRDALARMAIEHHDVILSDLRMPDLDGRALYAEIERRWPGRTRHVVFVTGDTLTAALAEFVASSGRPVIEKPFLPSEVRRVVAELLVDDEIASPD